MDSDFALKLLDTMATMFDLLAGRIEAAEKKLAELSAERGVLGSRLVDHLKPQSEIPILADQPFLSQEEVDDLLYGVTDEKPKDQQMRNHAAG